MEIDGSDFEFPTSSCPLDPPSDSCILLPAGDTAALLFPSACELCPTILYLFSVLQVRWSLSDLGGAAEIDEHKGSDSPPLTFQGCYCFVANGVGDIGDFGLLTKGSSWA
ncbi:unnamed protein product [Linum tenue]|uniref:Uncharacterized protein n=1 Tax=Linum tenue TaxID=586396 RepID=A0AAV0P0N2_9ROSI|nr:unnamed protein product [Linum tenue]